MPHRKQLGLLIGTQFAYGRNVWRGAGQYVQHLGRAWSFRGIRYDTPPSEAVRHLAAWNVQGVIAHVSDSDLIQALDRLGVPVVSTSDSVADLPFPIVGADDAAAGTMAAEYFLSQGFRHFAYLGASNLPYACHRGEGFRERLRRQGFVCLTYEPRHKVIPGYLDHTAWIEPDRKCQDWLASLPRPTALLACNDDSATQACDLAAEAGLRVPEDIAIMGVDDDELLCEFATPPISSVRIPAVRIGYEAARLLESLMAGRKAPPKAIHLLPTGITVRHSTDLLAVQDPELAEALRFIRSHAREPINVEDVVEEVAICRTLLERRFRAALGRTPLEEIHRVKIEQAKQLLAESNLSIPTVATSSGFRDGKHLHAVFVRYVGCPPIRYRAQFQAR
jgi:LacI family transcriptional regulator